MIRRLNVLYLSIIRLREDCKQKIIVYTLLRVTSIIESKKQIDWNETIIHPHKQNVTIDWKYVFTKILIQSQHVFSIIVISTIIFSSSRRIIHLTYLKDEHVTRFNNNSTLLQNNIYRIWLGRIFTLSIPSLLSSLCIMVIDWRLW